MPADAELDLIDVLETAPVGAIILEDRDSQVLFWNTSVLAILGDLQGESFALAATHGFFHDDRDFAAARAQLAAEGRVRNFETRIWREDGHESWAAVSMRPIRFEHNAATLIWYFDITEAKRRQHQLERSQDALLQVLDAAPTGAALTDGPQRISYWNTALLQIFPGTASDPGAAIRAGVAQAHAEIAASGQGTTFCVDGPGERFVAAWTFNVEFEGAPAELLWLHDVTELRRAERAAKAATATKSAFLATMSHEIRTPMNGVLAIAELLGESPLNPDQAGMVRIIEQSAESLIRVINDILDFSKLESSQLRVEIIPFRLDEVLDGVLQLLLPKAKEKGLKLELRRTISDGQTRLGDPLRLRQVLLNLIGNSIKFTLTGSVTLDVETRPDNQVIFRVIDTGIGIAADKIARLFTPYQQADVTIARNYGGTGLGLSISNALVTLMGGTLEVESTQGSGSIFTVSLNLPNDAAVLPDARPARAPETQAAAETQFWEKPSRAIAEAAGAVILCAEDNATNRDVLGRVLDRLGFVYDIVDDGALALAALDRGRHGIVLTDGHMPNLDGWLLARAIRQLEAANNWHRLPVMIVTADAVADIAGHRDRAAIDACLTKPLRREQLEDAVLQALPILADLRRKRAGALVSVAEANDTLDLRGLIDLVGDVRDDLHAVLLDFHGSAVAQHEKLSAAMAAGDRDTVIMSAHALKGAAGYAGSRIIAEHAGALEEGAKQGIALEALWHRIDAVALAVARLPAEIDASLQAQFPEAKAITKAA